MAAVSKNWRRIVTGFVAALLLLLSIWQLERYRAGIERIEISAGQTPATLYRLENANGPLIVIAHGFAGSRQLMEAFSLSLARAGYSALAYDLQGHGRNPLPMGGDVTVIEGTTARLIAELRSVIDAGQAASGWDGPVGVVGHSMASDVVIRASLEDPDIGPLVAISMFSQAVTETAPDSLLAISGAWEGRLRAEALRVLKLVDPAAQEGDTVSNAQVHRRVAVAPRSEHVSVLYSAASLRETLAWFDSRFERSAPRGAPARTGGWIAMMLASVVGLVWALAAVLPLGGKRDRDQFQAVPVRSFLVSALVVPPIAVALASMIKLDFLPVLVADYLTVHLAIYGLLQLVVLWHAGLRPGKLHLPAIVFLGVAMVVFGYLLDRYVASFALTSERWRAAGLIALGAVPFMLADRFLCEAGRASMWRRGLLRVGFLGSLVLAVVLDFEGLMFLVIIFPVIILFFVVFGLMGRWVGIRSGALSVGLCLGLILAWSLAASFPLFEA